MSTLLLSMGMNGSLILPAIVMVSLLACTLLLASRTDRASGVVLDLLLIAGGSVLACTAPNAWVLAAGWIFSSLPVFRWRMPDRATRNWLIVPHIASAIAVLLLAVSASVPVLGPAAIGLFIVAVMLRTGIFPLHGHVVAAFEHAPLLSVALFASGQLSIALLLNAPSLLPADQLGTAMDVLCVAACLSSLIAGVRAFAERKPRRVTAHVLLSVSSSAVAGLTCMDAKGITGGLLIWLMVAIASVGLVAVLNALEARTDLARDPRGHLGLNARAPRLGLFLLLFSLALIGLPGTLGFVAEDLLFHGALHGFPIIGIALPLATALNAIHLLRMYHLLFNGVLPKDTATIPDALPREAVPMLLGIIVLLVLGVVPDIGLVWSGPASGALLEQLASFITH